MPRARMAYFVKNRGQNRRSLREVQIFPILRTPQVQRLRLLVLRMGMWGLLRLPRIEGFAELMYKRWHAKRSPVRRAERQSA